MLFKKKAAVLIIAMTLVLALIAPAAGVQAYTPPAQIGEILTVDGVQYQVLGRGETTRQVFIYYYPDVNEKTVVLPTMIYSGGYDWKVTGILSGAFIDCTTPKTFVIDKDANFNWAYMCPDAFINKSKQTIEVNPVNGEWDTLYHILEYYGPKPSFPPTVLKDRDSKYVSFTNTTNSEDTLYIKVPAGTYTLKTYKEGQDQDAGKELRVYSNTTLYLKGVIYKRNPTEKALSSHMLTLGTIGLKKADGSYYAGGYNAGKNIKILYGTFDNGTKAGANNICRGSHLENLTIQSTVFKYLPDTKLTNGMTNSHCIELAGIKKATIKKCKFYNNSNCFSDNEAIQIESCGSDPTAKAHTNIAAPLDDTQTSNVTITKCRFEGFNYGCGSNHLSVNDCYKNMKFTYNTFIGCQKYCVCLYNYDKVTIAYNTLKNCSTLILDAGDQKSTNIKTKKNKNK